MTIQNLQGTLDYLQTKLLYVLKSENKCGYIVSTYQNAKIWDKVIPNHWCCLNDGSNVKQAKLTNKLLLSDLNQEDIFFGMYEKYGLQNVDYLPLSEFYYSEVKQLNHWCQTQEFTDFQPSFKEWLIREIVKIPYGKAPLLRLLHSDNPLGDPFWGQLTKDQQDQFLKLSIVFNKNYHKKIIGITLDTIRSVPHLAIR